MDSTTLSHKATQFFAQIVSNITLPQIVTTVVLIFDVRYYITKLDWHMGIGK